MGLKQHLSLVLFITVWCKTITAMNAIDEAGKMGKDLDWMEGFMVIAFLAFILASPMILIGIFCDGCRKCQKSWGFFKTVDIMSRHHYGGPRCPFCIEMRKMFVEQVDNLIKRYRAIILNRGYKESFLTKARRDVLQERDERAEKAKLSTAAKYQEEYLIDRFEEYLRKTLPIWPFSIR